MGRLPPAGGGSGRDTWTSRVRDRMRAQREELRGAPPFPVYGLSAPTLLPYALADFDRDARRWHAVTLGYGDPLAVAGPYLEITTASPYDREPRRDAEIAVRRALAAERDRLTIDLGDPVITRSTLRVSGRPERALVAAGSDLWAARTTPRYRTNLTVVGRGLRFTDVVIVTVDDLVPYWIGRADRLATLAERGAAPVAAELPWSAGLDAHRALLEAVRNCAPGTWPVGRGRPYRRAWDRAVREHQGRTGRDPAGAAGAVASLVNHVARLAAHADWFGEPAGQREALEETLRYAVLGQDVPSGPAQRAWERWWAGGRDTAEPDPGWLAAWRYWRTDR